MTYSSIVVSTLHSLTKSSTYIKLILLINKKQFNQMTHMNSNHRLGVNSKKHRTYWETNAYQGLRWYRGSVLAFGTQVRGFKPGRSRRIFQGEKILSTPSFGREVKPFVPCRIFSAHKRTRKCMRGSRSFRSKLPVISRPSSSSFHY